MESSHSQSHTHHGEHTTTWAESTHESHSQMISAGDSHPSTGETAMSARLNSLETATLPPTSNIHVSSHTQPGAEASSPVSLSLTGGAELMDQELYATNGLAIFDLPFGLEEIYDYDEGGHLPVHLGDRIGPDNRYRVIHKLGFGGFANVWLARDDSSDGFRYVALKILMAKHSTEDCGELKAAKLQERIPDDDDDKKLICITLDHFEAKGPNGTHRCLVHPVLGPRVSKVLDDTPDLYRTLRHLAQQSARGLACLHRHGICHGDFTAKNVLRKLIPLDDIAEHDLIKKLGEPQKVPVLTEKEAPHSLDIAPQYLVRPIDFSQVASELVTNEVQLIDFGESYDVDNPPKDLGIPQNYQPPELALDNKIGIGCDLWALAYVLFEIRTGRKILDTFDEEVDDYLYYMVLLLGKFPEPWWTTWTHRKNTFKDDLDSDGQVQRNGDEEVYGFRSLKELVEDGLGVHLPEFESQRESLEKEAKLAIDLLGQLLDYNPDRRLTAQAASKHPWFDL